MKTHKNHLKNQRARRKNPNIRQIKSGKTTKSWIEGEGSPKPNQGLTVNS